MDMSQYMEIFVEESKENLLNLNQCLLKMEKSPGDISLLDEIFRVAHTLKGMSGTMGFNRMSRLTHDMEDVLQALRCGEISADVGLIDLLFKCLDALENYISVVVETGTEGTEDNLPIINALSEILKKHNDSKQGSEASSRPGENTDMLALNQYDLGVIQKAAEQGNNIFQITVKLNEGCVLKSARAFIIFKTLERHSEIIKSDPAVQDIEDEKFELEFTVIVISKEDKTVFHKEINSIAEVEEVIIKEVDINSYTPAESYGIKSEASEDVCKSGDYSSADADAKTGTAQSEMPGKKAKTGKTVRVDIDRLDVLLNLVSELIIQKTRLEGLEGIEKTPDYIETVDYLEKITTNLHDAVMKVRMVPVETVFNRFPRMIRDISRDLGKNLELIMSGEDTELDRTVIDEIGDPLIHLLRNSADHGIESIEKRKSLGKPEKGCIALRAYQDGNNVVIEVEDDGGGINVEEVKKKAIARGLVSKEIADDLSKDDIIGFLFHPGFSTSEKVTDLSGRGVGLDVVKTKIEALGGVVEVETEYGKGSRFIIILPLTLAIIQALLIMVGNEKYAIQLGSIHKIIKISPDEIKLVQKKEVILYRDMVVPIVRLADVLEVEKEDREQQKLLTVVIVKRGERLAGFIVDKVLGQQEIVQKSLGRFLSDIKVITSATILGDGNVALILDVNILMQ